MASGQAKGDSRGWVNWAGDQSCRPAEVVRPADRDELAEAVAAAAAAGRKVSVAGSGHSFTEAAMTDGTMVRIEALKGVIDADPASGLVKVGAGTVLADLNEELARARAGDGEPRRHRPPDHRRGDLDRHPRHRRQAAQHLRPGRGDRAGPRRRQRAPAQRRHRPGAAAGGPGRGRRARRDLRRDPALRAGLHARPGRHAAPARGGARRLPGERRRQRPLRALHLPLRRVRPGAGAQPHRRSRRARAAGPPPTSTTSSWRTGRWRRSRRPASASRKRSRRSRGWPAASPPAAAPSTAATASSPTTAASASPRWSTACRARRGPRRRGG